MRTLALPQNVTLDGAIGMVRAGLLDEYRPFPCPAVQGRGRRLFPEGTEVPRLRRLDATTFGNGVTYAACAPAG